jgi:uncharacterized protein YukE
VTLTPQEITDLGKRLAETRHDINNALSLIAAASELIRMNPDNIPKMIGTLNEQPQRILSSIQQFSSELEQRLGTRRP